MSNVYADSACEAASIDDPLICGSASSDEEMELTARVKGVLNTVYIWIGILAVIFVIVGGVNYMTSNGDTAKIQRGKQTITYSVCGLVVALSAFAITNLAINSLNGTTSGSGGTVSTDRNKVRDIVVVSNTRLVAGQSVTLKTKIIPDYAKNKDLKFSSSNSSVASVDEKGIIKAKRAGETKISIESSDGPNKTVAVSVVKPVSVESITLSQTTLELAKGKTKTVTATVKPYNAAKKTYLEVE